MEGLAKNARKSGSAPRWAQGPLTDPHFYTAVQHCYHGRLEPISKSFEEDRDAGELHKSEEIGGVVPPANEESAFPMEPGKNRSTSSGVGTDGDAAHPES